VHCAFQDEQQKFNGLLKLKSFFFFFLITPESFRRGGSLFGSSFRGENQENQKIRIEGLPAVFAGERGGSNRICTVTSFADLISKINNILISIPNSKVLIGGTIFLRKTDKFFFSSQTRKSALRGGESGVFSRF